MNLLHTETHIKKAKQNLKLGYGAKGAAMFGHSLKAFITQICLCETGRQPPSQLVAQTKFPQFFFWYYALTSYIMLLHMI